MTTEDQPQQPDEVSQDQQELDQEQQGQEEPQHVTVEEFARLQSLAQQQQQALNQMAQMVNGLQGKIDTGLNAIRRDLSKQYQQASREERKRRVLQAVPEENREWVAQVLQEADSGDAEPPDQEQSAPQTSQQGQGTPTVPGSASNDAVSWVRSQGVDPNDGSINYAVLSDSGKTEEQRLLTFLESVHYAKFRQQQGGSQGTRTQPAQRGGSRAAPSQGQQQAGGQSGASPPVNTPGGGRGGFRSFEEVAEAFAVGRIDADTYEKEAGKHGVTVRR